MEHKQQDNGWENHDEQRFLPPEPFENAGAALVKPHVASPPQSYYNIIIVKINCYFKGNILQFVSFSAISCGMA